MKMGPKKLIVIVMGVILTGCVPAGGGKTSRKTGISSSVFNNSPGSVPFGHGRILEQNPIILSGNSNLPASFNVGSLLKKATTFISDGASLNDPCTSPDGTVSISDCYKVLKDPNAIALEPINGKWAFTPGSDAFWEVHTFGHTKKAVAAYLTHLSNAFTLGPQVVTTNPSYPNAIRSDLYTSKAYWDSDKTLTVFSQCQNAQVAFYTPSTFSICMGVDNENIGHRFVQDPSVLYHELGHAFVSVFSNIRNEAATATITGRSEMGFYFYDEMGAINEGLADFFSQTITRRTHIGEWSIGRFFSQSRPMIETDSIHQPGIGSGAFERLSYPDYLGYDPNSPGVEIEDIHYAGQIVSHYLTALTGDFTALCGHSSDTAYSSTMYLIAQTLAQLGDITSKGFDTSLVDTNVNLVPDNNNSTYWQRFVNPPNFRRFFQTMASHLLQVYVGNATNCPLLNLTQDRIEQLLDMYGLLMFKTYNNNANGYLASAATQPGNSATLNVVNPVNRLRSKLISKDLLKYDPTANAAKVYVIDKGDEILKIIENLKASGQITGISPQIESNLIENNGNGEISAGEVVGIALNLYNDSGSTMAGVQILANDWDHAKSESGELKLCNNFEDSFPLDSENAASLTGDVSTNAGDCNHITKSNGGEVEETMAPVCFVFNGIGSADVSSSSYISQEKLRENNGLSKSDCLGGASSTNDCYVRVIKGAETAIYGKIDAKKNYTQSYSNSYNTNNPEGGSGGGANSGGLVFNSHNLFLMEVNPAVPAGTTFDCRVRARFTNCDDCFHDSTQSGDDYLDYEFSGEKPFKILHFQFTVLN